MVKKDWTGINQLLKTECKKGVGFGLLVTSTLEDLAVQRKTQASDMFNIMDAELMGLLQAIEQYRAFWENVLHQEQFDEYMVTH
jgi:hypothetical protein